MDLRQSRRVLSSICLSCRTRLQSRRNLSTTQPLQADGDDLFAKALRSGPNTASRRPPPNLKDTQSPAQSSVDPPPRRAPSTNPSRQAASQNLTHIAAVARNEAAAKPSSASILSDSHHLHVYATKHNTHITLTKPNREPLLSVSAGNIGFRKAQRGSFDAAYQLASYSMGKMHERGMLVNMDKLEVVLRGYGPGREAFQKALLGSEGRGIKGKVTRVTDSTRLKFGGVRSKGVRRL